MGRRDKLDPLCRPAQSLDVCQPQKDVETSFTTARYFKSDSGEVQAQEGSWQDGTSFGW